MFPCSRIIPQVCRHTRPNRACTFFTDLPEVVRAVTSVCSLRNCASSMALCSKTEGFLPWDWAWPYVSRTCDKNFYGVMEMELMKRQLHKCMTLINVVLGQWRIWDLAKGRRRKA